MAANNIRLVSSIRGQRLAEVAATIGLSRNALARRIREGYFKPCELLAIAALLEVPVEVLLGEAREALRYLSDAVPR